MSRKATRLSRVVPPLYGSTSGRMGDGPQYSPGALAFRLVVVFSAMTMTQVAIAPHREQRRSRAMSRACVRSPQRRSTTVLRMRAACPQVVH